MSEVDLSSYMAQLIEREHKMITLLEQVTYQKKQIIRGLKKEDGPAESDTDTAPVEDEWWLGVPGMLLHCTFVLLFLAHIHLLVAFNLTKLKCMRSYKRGGCGCSFCKVRPTQNK